ncbi:MAG TPA: EpsI family protein [Candidatus Acidoferrum sp.]|nr:EpsI family protein [Candidatus Acidoferrum sp.]
MYSLLPSNRVTITAGLLIGALILLRIVSHGETIVPHQPLRELPYIIGAWSGQEYPLSQQVLHAVSVSDYTNRLYSTTGIAPVQLYVGFYGSQKTGDTIHSPKNCLPGSGWDPIRAGQATIALVGGRKIVVNEYVIQRDQDKQLVFYWYQGRGRVIASEYAAKFWMITDALSKNRTDGALVRVVTPMADNETTAQVRLVSFTQDLFPRLDEIIPR